MVFLCYIQLHNLDVQYLKLTLYFQEQSFIGVRFDLLEFDQ